MHSHSIYLWFWILLGYWAAPERTAIQTALLLVQLASEPSPLAQVPEKKNICDQVLQESKNNILTCISFDSYLTDGCVRSPISHHDVGMEINVVQIHWSGTHRHCSAHLTADTLWSTWGSHIRITQKNYFNFERDYYSLIGAALTFR